MSNQEANPQGVPVEGQKPRESIFNRPFSRRKVITGAGAAAFGAVSLALIGCSGDDDTKPGGSEVEGVGGEREFGVGEAQLKIEVLPGGLDELAIENALPQGIVIRKGSSLTAKGLVVGLDGAQYMALGITDPSRLDKDGKPQSFTGILADKLQPDQVKPGNSSFEQLVSANGGHYALSKDKPLLSLKDGAKGYLPSLASDSAAETITSAGLFFVDRDPLKKDHPLIENPVVPKPKDAIMPENGTFSKESDGRIVLKSSNGEAVARARYLPWKKEWKWLQDPESISDYTIREYADAAGFTFGIFDGDLSADISRLNSAEFTKITEQVGNQLVIGGALDARTVFAGYAVQDWKNILSNWGSIKADLESGNLPIVKYSWGKADNMVNYAAQNGMKIRAQHLIWGPDVMTSIFDGNFSSEELTKILEFTTKSRVLKYKGRIDEWDVPDEAAAAIEGGDAKQNLWFSKLGNTPDGLGKVAIDKVAQWVKETDANAKLVMVEDHMIEGSTIPNAIDWFKKTSNTAFNLIKHFKNANIPIDKVGIENNLWIYAAPTREQMAQTLQRIKDLGFGLGSTEANVGSSKEEGFYAALKTQNPASNPDELQATVYANLVASYLEAGGDFALGGMTDTTVWTAAKHPDTNPAIFDANKKPKPAYFAIRDVIKKAVLTS